MTSEDFDQFATAWTSTVSIYGKVADDFQVKAVFHVLSKFDIRDVKRALAAHMSDPDSGQYQPKPADIIRHIQGDTKTRAMLAWSKVDKAIRLIGSYESVVFDDEVIMFTIESMGGWMKICSTKEDEMPFVRNEFVTRYSSSSKKPLEDYPRKLVGVLESKNGSDFPDRVQKPILVGDESKAMSIYHGGNSEDSLKICRASDSISKVMDIKKCYKSISR